MSVNMAKLGFSWILSLGMTNKFLPSLAQLVLIYIVISEMSSNMEMDNGDKTNLHEFVFFQVYSGVFIVIVY